MEKIEQIFGYGPNNIYYILNNNALYYIFDNTHIIICEKIISKNNIFFNKDNGSIIFKSRKNKIACYFKEDIPNSIPINKILICRFNPSKFELKYIKLNPESNMYMAQNNLYMVNGILTVHHDELQFKREYFDDILTPNIYALDVNNKNEIFLVYNKLNEWFCNEKLIDSFNGKRKAFIKNKKIYLIDEEKITYNTSYKSQEDYQLKQKNSIIKYIKIWNYETEIFEQNTEILSEYNISLVFRQDLNDYFFETSL